MTSIDGFISREAHCPGEVLWARTSPDEQSGETRCKGGRSSVTSRIESEAEWISVNLASDSISANAPSIGAWIETSSMSALPSRRPND